MTKRGAGTSLLAQVRTRVDLCAPLTVLAISPTTVMAATPLCPCADVPDAPWSPLIVAAGIGVAALTVALKRKTGRGGRGMPRSVLARLGIMLTLVLLVGAISLAYNASASNVCDCSTGPTPTPAISPSVTPPDSPSPSPSDSLSPTPSTTPSPPPSSSASPSPAPTSSYQQGGGGSAHPVSGSRNTHGTAGLFVGIPYTGWILALSPGIAVVAGGVLLVGGAARMRRRRRESAGMRH